MEGADDWPHWAHGPDNNPVSTDSVIRAPYLTQWFGKPYFHAMPVISTAAAGRVFIASGHIAHHDREIPTLNTLVARNGYNGQVLWQRALPEGYLVHRSAFVATEDVFYLMDGNGVLQLDPETGSQLGRFEVAGIRRHADVDGQGRRCAVRAGGQGRSAGRDDESPRHVPRLGLEQRRPELLA